MRSFYILTFLISFGFFASKGQGERVLFTDNFGAYSNGESLSGNSSGWNATGVGDFTNKINSTFGASGSNCFGQLATTGAAKAYQELELKAGNRYEFKAYLKTTNNKIYSTIRINVGGTDVATSGNVSANYSWEELTISYTPSVDEIAQFIIQKTQGQVLNVDKVKIICSSCTNKRVVYDFHDSKEGWLSGGGCTLGLNDKGMILNATNTTPIARSGDLSQDLALNTTDYNRAKIIFKTPYAMSGGGFGKLFLYDVNGGNSQFATYDFIRDPANTSTFQTAEIDLTSNISFTGNIARIGIRAPWGIANGDQAIIQRIELYYECTPVEYKDIVSACDEFKWINGITYTESNDTSKHILTTINGCDSTITLNLTINTVDDSITVLDDFTLQANASGASYQWIDCNNYDTISGATDSLFTTQVSGDYAVEITQNGCVDTSKCYSISDLVSYNNVDNLNYEIGLFPNPATSHITLNLKGSPYVNIQLMDLQGKLLMSKNKVVNQEHINLSGISKGTYLLIVSNKQGSRQLKVQIK